MIHYFHGFQGNPQAKASVLSAALGLPLNAPHYTNEAEYFAAIDAAVAAAGSQPAGRAVFMGTSLGGFAACCAARLSGGTALVINPCLRPWEVLRGREGMSASWLERTLALWEKARACPPARVVAFINLDDELLAPFDAALAAAGITEVRAFPSGGHRAANFAVEIAPAIAAEILSAPTPPQ